MMVMMILIMMMHNEPNRDTAEERSSTDFGGESKYVADDDYDDA